jgi:hypothetical protein
MNQPIITDTGYKELLSIAEEQYQLAEKMYWLYQEKLHFDFYDGYIAQLAVYARQIQQIRLVNPQYIELKLKDVLVEVKKLWPGHGNEVLTAELVAKVALLLDRATALGWKQPLPENSVYSCEICGFTGRLGVDIVQRPFFNRVLRRDSTRWECIDIERCLCRTGR